MALIAISEARARRDGKGGLKNDQGGSHISVKEIASSECRIDRDVTLWDLMTALCFVMAFAGALASVKDSPKVWEAYALAVVIGFVIGSFCTWAMRAVVVNVSDRSSARPELQKEWHFRLLYLGAAIWIIATLFLGDWVTNAVVRFF
jgi:protein-S-isoprenylcysteine O-methyltransferase Ste14